MDINKDLVTSMGIQGFPWVSNAKTARREIFRIHSQRMSVAPDVDFDTLAAHTDSATGADIKAICTEAGMFAIREDRDIVTEDDFERAVEKVRGQAMAKGPNAEGMYA